MLTAPQNHEEELQTAFSREEALKESVRALTENLSSNQEEVNAQVGILRCSKKLT
jgi:hypothetical protein